MTKKTNSGATKQATAATKPARKTREPRATAIDWSAQRTRISAVQRDPVTGIRTSLTAGYGTSASLDPALKRLADK
jgi:hypothetical protein